jgi:leader peptidase (prepilin peptidase)/N-methyltransferase
LDALTEIPQAYWIAFAFLFGASVGSFLNVVIYRVPLGQSIVSPRSRCPHCEAAIPGWANVPLVSWLALGGRCRGCREPISPRYPLVEGLTGALFVGLLLTHGLGLRLFVDQALVAALVAVAFIDWDHQMIPDAITLPGIAIGLVCAVLLAPPVWPDALAGAVIVGGMMWALSAFYRWRTGQTGLGMGDVKLVAMLGAFLGLQPALGILVLGSLLGLAHGIVLIVARGGGRKTRIPFGPALALAGVLHVFDPSLVSRVLG